MWIVIWNILSEWQVIIKDGKPIGHEVTHCVAYYIFTVIYIDLYGYVNNFCLIYSQMWKNSVYTVHRFPR